MVRLFLNRAILCAIAAVPLAAAPQEVDFSRSIEPVLHKKCYGCHGAVQQMNGLRLDDKEAALKGGYSGAAILPGKGAESPIVQRVTSEKNGFKMPPAGPRLSSAEIELLTAWIDRGAEWPIRTAKDSKPSASTKAKLWSLQPVKRPPVPNLQQSQWIRNPIDAFVLARLQKEQIAPSPEVDKNTLIRRVTLDLIGMPPTPEELKAFQLDGHPDAYQRVVDRLLDSPHYGERWARHWLDLARYADSDGYEKDLPRPHAWRWRQWVIDALNRDMPFDQFTIAQIAGDLLPGASTEQRVATGFHRNTLKNREGGVKLEQTFFEETVDRVNTVSTVWLGLTVGCAQCHDHKYDPISQKDYYQLYAFFDNVEEDYIDAPKAGEVGPYLQQRQTYLQKRQELLEEYGVPKLIPEWEDKVRLAAKSPGKWTDWDITYDVLFQMTDGGHKFIWIDPKERTFKQQEMLTDYFIEWYHFVVPTERYKELKFKELQAKLRDLKRSYPQLSQAATVFESADPHPTFLRVRGDYGRNGIEVQPGGLAALPPMKSQERASRLDLARWLVAPENPLTARVAVNRMWQEFFGRGLARTSEDFGVQGETPSHPELLDWLASEFIQGEWKTKRMHKMIVMSAAYRQASAARPELTERDPENILLSRQNRLRLQAEFIRDSALRASGLLSDTVGGRSVFPPQPKGVAELTYAWNAERWNESTGPDRYRRGLYIFFQRTAPYPQLINFDAPDSNVGVSQRRRSNTPLQALNLMNDPVFMEAAQALAVRVLREASGSWNARLDYAFRLCLTRNPTERERQLLTESFQRQKVMLDKDPDAVKEITLVDLPGVDRIELAAWVGIGRSLLNTDEFVTRE